MIKDIIIPAAGLGTRLGMGKPKALVEIEGQPLIHWQLKALADSGCRIHIVTGFRGRNLEAVVNNYANAYGVPYVHCYRNKFYRCTSVVDSLRIAIRQGNIPLDQPALIIDGDLIFDKATITPWIECSEKFRVGIRKTQSAEEHPVGIIINEDRVIQFQTWSPLPFWQWACICVALPSIFGTEQYIYQAMHRALIEHSIAWQVVNAPEIDTQEDLEKAKLWIKGRTK